MGGYGGPGQVRHGRVGGGASEAYRGCGVGAGEAWGDGEGWGVQVGVQVRGDSGGWAMMGGVHTFTVAGVRQVVHVTEELHEVAAQGGHDISRVAPRQPPHHLNGQTPHNPGLIIQSHKQRP